MFTTQQGESHALPAADLAQAGHSRERGQGAEGGGADLRRGGQFGEHRGTYLEIEPPARTIQTWLFEGWPDAHAVESTELQETYGVTRLTHTLAFRDQAGRDHMTKYDGLAANYDNVADYLRSLLDPKETVSG